ncbi:hypothetical protein PspLS_09724 [Pyricularia sp. CBS 133598]|nr:hypothetical protein PspLS_09724 [Pyricularia sp. CBS 133598]
MATSRANKASRASRVPRLESAAPVILEQDIKSTISLLSHDEWIPKISTVSDSHSSDCAKMTYIFALFLIQYVKSKITQAPSNG